MRWVTRSEHKFSYDVEVREEGGTPNILGIIRAAIPLQLQVCTNGPSVMRLFEAETTMLMSQFNALHNFA